MKKLISVLMAIVLMLSSVCAFAATEVNWADLQEQGAAMIEKGDFVTLDEVAVKLWVPTAFAPVELSDEDRADGYIAYFMLEEESAAISVVYVDTDGMSLEDYKTQLEEIGATEIEDVIINGLPAVSYVLADDDTVAVAFATVAGYILEMSAAPKSNEGVLSVISFVMASIQSAE